MSALKFGLNVKPKKEPSGPPSRIPPKKPTIFDDNDGDEEPDEEIRPADLGEEISVFDASAAPKRPTGPSPPARPTAKSRLNPPKEPPTLKNKTHDNAFADLSSDRASQKHGKTATELDSAIYDYDSFHDVHTSVSAARKAAEKQDAIERKPKYINNLLDAAARRKQDQLVAREKLLQREREAEGDEFADKEKFVTGAYKLQQAEAQKIEEEQKKKTEEEERRRRERGGGMQSFYRGVMDESEKRHQEAMEAARKLEQGATVEIEDDDKKTDVELAAEMKRKGVKVDINEEGQVTDKRQLLTAGLNIGTTGQGTEKRSADHLRAQARPAQNAFQGKRNDQRAMRERQTKMLEEQLAESTKRAADEEAEEKRKLEHAAKSRKTEGDISSAKERYLARKREVEAAKKAG